MRRKRLQHGADVLCQMFCGWRLVNSYRDLESLGSGTLTVDALSGQCGFEGRPINRLTIAGELQAWLEEDLTANSIPRAGLKRAQLTAVLSRTEISAKERMTATHHISAKGDTINKGPFIRLKIDCKGEIETDEKTYTATQSELVEWPRGWLSEREHR
jgi:hypothetical protein